MTRAQRGSRHLTLLVLTVILTVLAIASAAAAQDEEITVSCYKGNLDEGNNVGNVTVTAPENAGQSCNTTYYECQDKCLGCFSDADLERLVCYDNTGTRTLN
ncbi:MAG: hypothetical protein EG824_14345 [Deltaproteobacteria bacterium]|nr:hypothetical protein [Deltaproteobacteria bacterium]